MAEYLDPFWDYYDELLAYRENPTPAKAERLSTRFGALFSVTTDYYALDNRIGKTKAKKAARLKVLAHPEIPLHIDAAELGARQRVCKRDVSFCPRTADGARE